MTNRREFLASASAAAAAWTLEAVGGSKPLSLAAAAARSDSAQTQRPNIIFILADDYGIGGMSCYGSDVYKTPHLDELAATGMRFEYCFAAPLCAPSRALCLTGRYGFRTGVTDNPEGGKITAKSETTIAKVLKQAGYVTGVAGKWRQLQYLSTPQEARDWGFDEFVVWGLGKKKAKAKREGPKKAEDPNDARYWGPIYNKNGKWMETTDKDYGPDLLHEFAVDFITRHKNESFFLYYPMVLVHGPLVPTPDSSPGSKNLRADYITYMDKLVGKLVAELDRLGLREKTPLVFTGDNGLVGGGTLHGRKIDGGKGSMKEGGSRVPLIVNWKGTTPPGKVSNDLVDLSDFFPTFAELAGVRPPEGVMIDGHSFAPQIKGERGKPREWVFVQLGSNCYVRDERWKLNNDGQMFDMKDAPFAELPVPREAADAELASARKRLDSALRGLIGSAMMRP